MSKPVGAHTRKPTAEELAATDRVAVDAINPGNPPSGAQHQADVPAEEQEIQYQLDPQMVQQAVMNTNARLIATMVNNNAMMEVALEQERRAHGETRAKLAALQAMYREDSEG